MLFCSEDMRKAENATRKAELGCKSHAPDLQSARASLKAQGHFNEMEEFRQ